MSAEIAILMYHEVAEQHAIEALARKTQRGYILAQEEFARQMRLLRARGYAALSLPELAAGFAGSTRLPTRAVIITFDDGFAGNHRCALPILAEYGLTATFFVVTRRIGDAQMLDWTQLREMQQAGMSIQSHTANHPLLSTLDAAQTRAELADSKAELEDGLGRAVTYVSLPNGDSNPHYRSVARDCGYAGGCASIFGFNDPQTDPYFLRRIAVKHELGFARFEKVLDRDPRTLMAMRAKANAKAAVANVLGKRNYDRLYNLVFGVDEQDKSKQPV